MAKWKWEKVDKLTGIETFLKPKFPDFTGNGPGDVDSRSAQWALVRRVRIVSCEMQHTGALGDSHMGDCGVLSRPQSAPANVQAGIVSPPPTIYSFKTRAHASRGDGPGLAHSSPEIKYLGTDLGVSPGGKPRAVCVGWGRRDP